MTGTDTSEISKAQWKIATIVMLIIISGMALCGVLNLWLMQDVVEKAVSHGATTDWTKEQMSTWVLELQRRNPDLNLPPVEKRP